MKTVTYIKIDSIQPNPHNPRKRFNASDLEELASSIRSVGVLQPITLRTVEGGYEIVCGERRWQAAKIAKQETIPAIVRKLTDEEAMDIAITENLQRKDIDPFEECDAFRYLVDHGQGYDDIAARFGKSTIFIRGRLKLADLIDPLRELYNDGHINVSHCLELCKHPQGNQQRFYEEHYQKEDDWRSWRNDSIKELREKIDRSLKNLDDVEFDKEECISCSNNTANSCLFPELGYIKCMNRTCFDAKVVEHECRKIMNIYENQPETLFYKGGVYGDIVERVVDMLTESGIQFVDEKVFDWRHPAELPEKTDSMSDEEYAERLQSAQERMVESERKYASGEYRKGYHVSHKMYVDLYVRNSNSFAASSEPDSNADIISLRAKDAKNKEICIENTRNDASEFVRSNPIQGRIGLTEMEELLMLYCMAEWKEQRNYISDDRPIDENLESLRSMSPENRNDIIRRFILDKLGKHGFGAEAKLRIEMIRQHYPEQVGVIELKYEEVYKKRKEKIEARIYDIKAAQGKKGGKK